MTAFVKSRGVVETASLQHVQPGKQHRVLFLERTTASVLCTWCSALYSKQQCTAHQISFASCLFTQQAKQHHERHESCYQTGGLCTAMHGTSLRAWLHVTAADVARSII
jgi:hypothetical protein